MADLIIDEVIYEEYDSLLLTGCMDIFDVLTSSSYIDFIQNITRQDNFIIGSISSSPALLAKAGVLKNKNFTVGLVEEARTASRVFDDANYLEELVVQDGNLITARGSAFIEFGIQFGKLLNLHFEEGWYRK